MTDYLLNINDNTPDFVTIDTNNPQSFSVINIFAMIMGLNFD